jgi:hypothetical protein
MTMTMTVRTAIGQQGEVKIYRIDAVPEDLAKARVEQDALGRWIISHSERGHHHVLPEDVELLEPQEPQTVPAGMRILYAIVENPTALVQTASSAHGEINLAPGVYELRVSREFNPFLEEARAVRD